jgi:hypothetical protein
VTFDIIEAAASENGIADLKPSALNQIYNCYGHPEDGPAVLVLRNPEEPHDTHKEEIVRVTSLEEDPLGNTHFTGHVAEGGPISGFFLPGPAKSELVGKATIRL